MKKISIRSCPRPGSQATLNLPLHLSLLLLLSLLNCQICPFSLTARRLKQFQSTPASLPVVQQKPHLSLSCSEPITVAGSSRNQMQPGVESTTASLQRCFHGWQQRQPSLSERNWDFFFPKGVWGNERWIAKTQWTAITTPWIYNVDVSGSCQHARILDRVTLCVPYGSKMKISWAINSF